ncbi:MAG: endonuclease/exonuclease/phosphatase family protein [Dongiaceae bacterium]
MRVVTYNIQWGKGLDERVDLDRIVRTIGDCDIIALQEVERHWRNMNHTDQVARLNELMPKHWSVYGIAVDVGMRKPLANGHANNTRRQYGNLILTRWPISSTRTFPLPNVPVHGHIMDQSMVIEAVVEHPTRPFRVYSTHLNYVSRRQRIGQCEKILQIVRDAPMEGGPAAGLGVDPEVFGADWMALARDEIPTIPLPAILLGDFNMHVGSPEYDVLVGPIDPCYGRLCETGLFADALTVSGMPEEEGWTHPGEDKYGKKRIDHIFVTPDLVGTVQRGWIDYDADGSDHLPVFVEMDID